MAALVVVALFWGNCFSCPQLLAALHSHHSARQAAHGCCHKNGSAATECQSQGLKSFVKAPQVAQAEALPVATGVVERLTPVALRGDANPVTAAEPAAPDLLSLHSSFRI